MEASPVILEDLFEVIDLNPGGDNFEHVDRVVTRSENFDFHVTIDINKDLRMSFNPSQPSQHPPPNYIPSTTTDIINQNLTLVINLSFFFLDLNPFDTMAATMLGSDPLKLNQKFTLALATTINLDGSASANEFTQVYPNAPQITPLINRLQNSPLFQKVDVEQRERH